MLDMRPQSRRWIPLLSLVLALVAQRAPAGGDLFEEIYRRGQPIQDSLKTIKADFTEETTSRLLTQPLVAHGTLIAVRPSDVVLLYTKPEQKTLRLDAQTMMFLWPDRQVKESRSIADAQKRVQRYFVDKSPQELRSHFTIAASEDKARPGTYRLDMIPKRKQIQQGLERLELWLRQDTLMLSAMRMTFPGGDTKLMTFDRVRVNEPVAPGEMPSIKP